MFTSKSRIGGLHDLSFERERDPDGLISKLDGDVVVLREGRFYKVSKDGRGIRVADELWTERQVVVIEKVKDRKSLSQSRLKIDLKNRLKLLDLN